MTQIGMIKKTVLRRTLLVVTLPFGTEDGNHDAWLEEV